MRFALLASAWALFATPALAADPLYALYAAGRYDAAMRAGEADGGAAGLALAARAALADAAMRDAPCLDCLKRAEADARRAVAADDRRADSHVWLAASLGLEGRITGIVRARLADSPGEARQALDSALRDDPRNPYALAAMGGWNIEIVRVGGAYLAREIYGAEEGQGLGLFDKAVAAGPGNVAVRYQIALSLAGYDAARFHARIADELAAAIHLPPQTAYETFIQARARELLALLKTGDVDAFAAKVRRFQGYPA